MKSLHQHTPRYFWARARAFARCPQCIAALICAASIAPAQALPGELDATFGSGGLTRATASGTNLLVTAAAQQSDGHIVVVGRCLNPSELVSFCVLRFKADGTPFDARSWHPLSQTSGATPYAVAIDAQDRIVIGGGCTSAPPFAVPHFCLTRLQSNGITDTQFGTGEVRTTVSSGRSEDAINAIVVQPDGKIVAGGYCNRGVINAIAFCMVRYLENGAIDTSFGDQGVSVNYLDTSRTGVPSDVLRAMTLLANGDIVAVGDCEVSVGVFYFCAVIVSSNGAVVANMRSVYGSTMHASSMATAVVQQADGNLLIGGRCSSGDANGGVDFCVVRRSPTLAVDATFGVGGVVRTAIAGGNYEDLLTSLAVQPDGRIIAAGQCKVSGSPLRFAFCWARYLSNGMEDRAILSNTATVGTVRTEFTPTTSDRAVAALLQADGSVVLAGECETGAGTGQFQVCAAKYQGGPFAYTHCSPDIDGDGKFNPLIDGLIMARIAAGMRTAEVMNGIRPPANARRSSWNAGIASYLQRECGIRDVRYTSLEGQ